MRRSCIVLFFLLLAAAAQAAPDTVRVFFPDNTARLTAGARETLDAALYRGFFDDGVFQIYGYADSSGGNAYNDGLSEQRAQAVRAYLVDTLHLKIAATGCIGYGEQQARGGRGDAGRWDRVVQIVRRVPERKPSVAAPKKKQATSRMEPYYPLYTGGSSGNVPPGFDAFVERENRRHHAWYLRRLAGDTTRWHAATDESFTLRAPGDRTVDPGRRAALVRELAAGTSGPGPGNAAEELALLYALEGKADSALDCLNRALQVCPAADPVCADVWNPNILGFYQFARYKTLPGWRRFESAIRQRYAARKDVRHPAMALDLLLTGGLDQSVRFPLSVSDPELPHREREVHVQNKAWIRNFIRRNGFPRISEVGADAADAAFLLVQHTEDTALQRTVLDLMQPLLAAREVSFESYALLTDRYLVHVKGYQWYGTQFQGDTLYPIQDAINVNKRRKAVGLAPLGILIE